MKTKVSRRAYQRTRQTELASFARNVFIRIAEDPAYAFLKTQSAALSTALEQYESALATARNRGRVEVAVKNAAQKTLTVALNKVADVLDEQVANDSTLITGAGFSQQQSPTRFKGRIAPPEVVRVGSTGRKGEIRVQLSDAVPGVVLTHAMEYSEDKSASWKNGVYHTHNNFLVDGLPATGDLWLRFKAIGRANNKSNWSEPITAAVL